jgi:hypothetical protein
MGDRQDTSRETVTEVYFCIWILLYSRSPVNNIILYYITLIYSPPYCRILWKLRTDGNECEAFEPLAHSVGSIIFFHD